jgi:hypothetical protein
MNDPKEGTILTVLRAAADAAETHAGRRLTRLRTVLEARLRTTRPGGHARWPARAAAAGVVDCRREGDGPLLDALLPP